MSPKATIATASALLVVGVGAFISLRPRAADRQAAGSRTPQHITLEKDGDRSASFSPDSATVLPTRSRDRFAFVNADLIAKYGESRTNLSKHVGQELVGLLEDSAEMLDWVTSKDLGATFGGDGSVTTQVLGELGDKLKLNESQEKKLAEMQSELIRRETAKVRTTVDQIRQKPEAVMELLLASDAVQRGQMPAADYEALQDSLALDIQGLPEILGEENHPSDALKDEAFVQQLKGLLEADQSAVLEAALQEKVQAQEGAAGKTHLPAMALEDAETKIGATRKIMGGALQIMKSLPQLSGQGPK